MGHATTNRGLVATGTIGLVLGQCLGRGNTTIPVKGDYLIGLGVQSTTAASLAGGSIATGTMTVLYLRTHARETYAPPHKVLTNDDLLTEILIQLPILCIHLFTTVSKQWLRILTSPYFTRKRSQITKVDPPVGHFVNHIRSLFKCDFVSLDSRLRLKKSAMDNSFTLGSTKEAKNVKILQSCNGLLLCSGSGRLVFDYVYNPSTNQFKRLPHPNCSLDNSPYYRSAGLRMAFDPTKSPHYKLVDARRTSCNIDIQIYSLKTCN
ncbi:ribonuclease H-like domain-containing protein [Tanacetum coccineum]